MLGRPLVGMYVFDAELRPDRGVAQLLVAAGDP
jgi:hypothetical protein